MGNTGDANGTYIRLYRKLLDWEWYHDINTKVLFLHLLITVNWNEGQVKGIKIRRGETIKTNPNLSSETGLTISQVKTALSHLLSSNDITIKRYGKLRVIRVSNFLKYQDCANDRLILAEKSPDESPNNRPIQRPNIATKSPRSNKGKEREEDKKEKKTAPAENETPDPLQDDDDDEGWMSLDEIALRLQGR